MLGYLSLNWEQIMSVDKYPSICSRLFHTRWSIYEITHSSLFTFTFIYNRSTNMNYFIYTSHHFTPHGKICTQWIDLAPNVWLHSSVGRASHRYCGGHAGSNPVEALIFFRLFLSNCLSWKICCDDHSSLLFHTMMIFKIDSVCSVIRSVTRYSYVRLSFLPMVLLVACTLKIP